MNRGVRGDDGEKGARGDPGYPAPVNITLVRLVFFIIKTLIHH